MAIYKPFFSYNNDFNHFYPDTGREATYSDQKTVERFDHIAASGAKSSYTVGSRDFIRVQFRWQTDAQKTSWETFWDAVKDGSEFVYHDDDSYKKSGTPTCGDGTVCGVLQSGGAVDNKRGVTFENIEFEMTADEVWGYWVTPELVMREVV